jgi:uncharacterized protein YceH (UPF0502 family)
MPRFTAATGLSAPEIRVLGCLLEKQRTTPDAYPLSLNALRLACNQSTNREPVVDYDESVIRDALHRLERRGLTRLASGAGSRAAKYRHLLAEQLPMDDAEQAVTCLLLLRGSQTPGELKQRAERIHPFADLAAVGDTLERLRERGLAARLARRPGQKEERYEHLLAAEQDEPVAAPAPAPASAEAHLNGAASGGANGSAGAIGAAGGAAQATADHGGSELEQRVARLEREVAALREAVS